MFKNKKSLPKTLNQLIWSNQLPIKFNHPNQKVTMNKMMACYGLKNANKPKSNSSNNQIRPNHDFGFFFCFRQCRYQPGFSSRKDLCVFFLFQTEKKNRIPNEFLLHAIRSLLNHALIYTGNLFLHLYCRPCARVCVCVLLQMIS